MFNLFKKQPKPIDPAAALKQSIISSFQDRMVSALTGQMQESIVSGVDNMFTTIMNGKKVPIVKADKKKETEDQETIYKRTMDAIHGDRDMTHKTQSKIDIKAFSNDSLSKDERDEVYEILDAINKLNPDEEDDTEVEEEVVENTTNNMASSIVGFIYETMKPIISMMISFVMCMASLVLITKMSNMINAI